jgi:hypothetical protein
METSRLPHHGFEAQADVGLSYARVDTRFVLDRRMEASFGGSAIDFLKTLLTEVVLCERKVLGLGDDDSGLSYRSDDMTHMAETLAWRLRDIGPGARYLTVDATGAFLPIADDQIQPWKRVPGFLHRHAIETGRREVARVDLSTGRLLVEDAETLKPLSFFDRRARVADFGLHVADDPLFLQFAAAIMASRDLGYEVQEEDPVLVHARCLLNAVEDASYGSRPDSIDLECLRVVRSGLLTDVPLDYAMEVLLGARDAVDDMVTKDARVFRLARMLNCPVGSFRPCGGDDLLRWQSCALEMGMEIPLSSQDLCLEVPGQGVGKDTMEPLVRLGLGKLESVDGLLEVDGVIDVKAYEDGHVLVRDGADGMQVLVHLP